MEAHLWQEKKWWEIEIANLNISFNYEWNVTLSQNYVTQKYFYGSTSNVKLSFEMLRYYFVILTLTLSKIFIYFPDRNGFPQEHNVSGTKKIHHTAFKETKAKSTFIPQMSATSIMNKIKI